MGVVILFSARDKQEELPEWHEQMGGIFFSKRGKTVRRFEF